MRKDVQGETSPTKSAFLWYNKRQSNKRNGACTGHAYAVSDPRESDFPMADTYDTTTVPLKRCTKCGAELPATSDFFRRDRHKKSGLSPHCRKCVAQYYASHREQIRAKKAEQYADPNGKSRKYAREYATKYLSEHREERRQYAARYNAEHREENRQRTAKYYAEHPEYRGKYYAEHRDKMREDAAKYRKAHPEVIKTQKHRRRTRKYSLPDTFTSDQAIAALNCWQWRCAYCDVSLAQLNMFDDIRVHFDHFIPLADPRSDNPGTVAENMLPTCAKCNFSKTSNDPLAWITRKFGPRKTKNIIARIQAYFEWVRAQNEQE